MVSSNLSDRGVLVALVNLEPLRVASRYTGATVEDAKNIFYEIGELLSIEVDEWIIGGHSLGSHAASDHIVELPGVRRLIMWGVGGLLETFHKPPMICQFWSSMPPRMAS